MDELLKSIEKMSLCGIEKATLYMKKAQWDELGKEFGRADLYQPDSIFSEIGYEANKDPKVPILTLKYLNVTISILQS